MTRRRAARDALLLWGCLACYPAVVVLGPCVPLLLESWGFWLE